MSQHAYLDLFNTFEPPFGGFDEGLLGPASADELATVRKIWLTCGYAPGVGAYLNFFLLRDFIETHDAAFPQRFQTLRSMADSFYRTDLFVRDVTDSGRQPTGGIASEGVRATLQGIMQRHQKLAIPHWMMAYFGFSLVENVEKECSLLTHAEKQQHLDYMARAFRLMGLAFSSERPKMEEFSRMVEGVHTGLGSHAEKHVRNILLVGEMVGVRSTTQRLGAMLPDKPRALFESIHSRVRPRLLRRSTARMLGRLLIKQAVGKPPPDAAIDEGPG